MEHTEDITLHEQHGQRILRCHGSPHEPNDTSIRILTEEQMGYLSEDDWQAYHKKARLVVQHGWRHHSLTDGDVIKAFDYLRNAVRRQKGKRA